MQAHVLSETVHMKLLMPLLVRVATVAYVAQDGASRRATVDQVRELSFEPERPRRRCNATIVMMDDRREVAVANSSKETAYFHKAFALNYLYAARHGMEFMVVRPVKAMHDSWLGASGLCPAWCRVKILAALVASHRLRHGCHWVLYIDSDAFLNEHHVNWLDGLDTARNADVHVAIAREELPAGGFRSPRKRPHGVRVPSLNAGVLFVQASEWASRFLAAWLRAAELPLCEPFRQSWPCEQQCFHELLRNRSLLPEGWRTRIATAPMQLFNSPCAPAYALAAVLACPVRARNAAVPRNRRPRLRAQQDHPISLCRDNCMHGRARLVQVWAAHPPRMGWAGRGVAPHGLRRRVESAGCLAKTEDGGARRGGEAALDRHGVLSSELHVAHVRGPS